ncbi:helix-turn-helix transcriptional regulator [Pseudoponticoccus marisrubri]|uniref:Transcriptional regulator n=1 Tax=Pseudoponticoccus marisrubri TaxID=1685382 RepID=A0A0W7WME6_9RHOB|nr:helix-turn-helix domain-containing protein [Pseudoponticoccus marisrubri]KUF11703.1 transcriptional regulator [Pseudoponticoccus marisrubri]
MGKRAIFGDLPPAFPSKATLAAELDISESTVDEWVKRDFLPKPIRRGGAVRWCWAEVAACLHPQTNGDTDQFMAGLDNV